MRLPLVRRFLDCHGQLCPAVRNQRAVGGVIQQRAGERLDRHESADKRQGEPVAEGNCWSGSEGLKRSAHH